MFWLLACLIEQTYLDVVSKLVFVKIKFYGDCVVLVVVHQESIIVKERGVAFLTIGCSDLDSSWNVTICPETESLSLVVIAPHAIRRERMVQHITKRH
jgi:hypothetical protein